jgi:hypothetical protein
VEIVLHREEAQDAITVQEEDRQGQTVRLPLVDLARQAVLTTEMILNNRERDINMALRIFWLSTCSTGVKSPLISQLLCKSHRLGMN